MEDTAGVVGSSSSLPPEVTVASSLQRGQKRGAPDDEEEEDELDEADDGAPPARQLFEFLRVHPGGAADAGGAAAGASAAGQEPVDVTLRLGVGPLAGDYRGGTVDTTLRLRLGSAATPGEDDGRRFQSHGKPATGATLGAASNAEPDFDEGLVRDAMVAALFHEPTSEDEEEGFFPDDDFAMACVAATAGDGSVGSGSDDDAAGRPSSVLGLNEPCPSELPDGAPDPSDLPVPDPAAVDDDDLAAHVDERGVATETVEQRRRSSTPFDLFCSPVHVVRAPGVLIALSS
ncbi:hypothetical protein SEVIR_1G029340v4 [Setaria viridis]|uniref:Uncharacterized protein n=1 Tax=Setaria viridis TaxID=4556 RepID=A0A4U6W3S7_SETVI|nr:uncharacterized protein LOC117836855 [Setaria viridis]TKW37130.1 hypothetical protein SEVIR_1G029340v2 [Setaria viridis]TKW37131.1 hypothetical protein SEVIR_1G029340v2 [Setaria viridis]